MLSVTRALLAFHKAVSHFRLRVTNLDIWGQSANQLLNVRQTPYAGISLKWISIVVPRHAFKNTTSLQTRGLVGHLTSTILS